MKVIADRIQPQLPVNFNGLAIIGEAPGKNEIEQGLPFVGKAGELLDMVLAETGIVREDCLISNVFLSRPDNNKIDHFFRLITESDGDFISQYGLYRNRVVKTENRDDMKRLDTELETFSPKVILLLGATALWRVLRQDGITAKRGEWSVLHQYNHIVGVLPTWHPSAVLRNRNDKMPQFISDFKQVADVLRGLV